MGLALIGLLACDPGYEVVPGDGTLDPSVVGPYGIGVTTVDWVDARGTSMTAEVWYPGDVPDGDTPDPYPEIPLTLDAHRDVDALPGPWPLVAFSHGNAGIRYQSAFLTEWLAGHGYVVVAPDHPYNTLLDLDTSKNGEVLVNRPGDIVSAVDMTIDRFDVDGSRYAMIGHSFGGWTSVAVGGGVTDFAAFEAWCAENDADMCGITPASDTVPDAPDPRAFVMVPMAPCGWYTFGDTGLDATVPALLLGAELDEDCPLDTETAPFAERLAHPVWSGTVAAAGHYVFSDICRIGDLQPECSTEDWEGDEEQLRVLITAWLGWRFSGNAAWLRWVQDSEDVTLGLP